MRALILRKRRENGLDSRGRSRRDDEAECASSGLAKRALENLQRIRLEREAERAGWEAELGEVSRESQVDEIMRQAEVPLRYRSAKLAELDGAPKNPDWKRGGYCLRGVTGCGKSTVAAALVRDWLMRKPAATAKHVAWVRVGLFVERVKSASHPQSPERPVDILREFRRKKLIVLDDLGQQRDHDWDKSVLINLLWQVYDEEQLLVVTTQKKLEELELWHDAFASRIGALEDIRLRQIDRRHAGSPG